MTLKRGTPFFFAIWAMHEDVEHETPLMHETLSG
jgi:hypothetical protein